MALLLLGPEEVTVSQGRLRAVTAGPGICGESLLVKNKCS